MSGRKTRENTQFALVSSTATRAGAGLAPLANSNGTEPLADVNGVLWLRLSGDGPPGFPDAAQGRATALVASQLIVTGSALLRVISGFNGHATSLFYAQVYDLAAGPPGGGDQPVQSMPVGALTEFSWSPADWEFSLGIVFALSTSPVGFVTAGANGWWNAQWWAP